MLVIMVHNNNKTILEEECSGRGKSEVIREGGICSLCLPACIPFSPSSLTQHSWGYMAIVIGGGSAQLNQTKACDSFFACLSICWLTDTPAIESQVTFKLDHAAWCRDHIQSVCYLEETYLHLPTSLANFVIYYSLPQVPASQMMLHTAARLKMAVAGGYSEQSFHPWQWPFRSLGGCSKRAKVGKFYP